MDVFVGYCLSKIDRHYAVDLGLVIGDLDPERREGTCTSRLLVEVQRPAV